MASRRLGSLTALLLVATAFGADARGCRTTAGDEDKVVAAVRAMYAALTADDLTLFDSVTTKNFLAYDGGERYSGDELITLIKKLHASGTKFVWTVQEPEVHVTCNSAWIRYVNRGSVENASGKKPVTWLESAVFEKQSGHWKIRFFHSTRVPEPRANANS